MTVERKDIVLKQLILELTQDGILSADELLRRLHKCGVHIKQRELTDALTELVDAGELMQARGTRYGHPEAFGCLIGTFCATGRGYAFVRPEHQPQPDIFIPPHRDLGAWHGDRVLISVGNSTVRVGRAQAQKNRQEGEVLRILTQVNDELIGVIRNRGKMTVFHDDSGKLPEIVVSKKHLGEAHPGDRVAVKVLFRGNHKYLPQGVVTKIFGSGLTLTAAAAAILHENAIVKEFPAEVIEQASLIPNVVLPDDFTDRSDLRELVVFTIDGDTSKDFDDAVSLETLPNGNYRLGVHIADVSHYVTPGSPLDAEAYRRGTSVYYADQVIPMLPHSLSNGICSLNPDVNRLAFSAFIELNRDGSRRAVEFHHSVICSHARLTYNEVNRIFAGDPEICAARKELVPILEEMHTLSKTLNHRRMMRGALDLDIPEAVILCDDNGKVCDVQKRGRGDAERLIEEFMLIANEAVAETLCKQDMPAVYRVHEDPDPEKLRIFARQARLYGYQLSEKDLQDTRRLQDVLDRIAKNPEHQALPTLLLRSLARARYAPQCLGHYGLAAKYYLHFTSPIRRYPDLVVHRMLSRLLVSDSAAREDRSFCEEASLQSTEREQAADTASRDIERLYMADYMAQYIGQSFEGYISSITNFGIYVQLDNMIEGMVRLDSIQDDWYDYDPDRMTLSGRNTGTRYRLGMRVHVTLINSSCTTGRIDFIFTPKDAAVK